MGIGRYKFIVKRLGDFVDCKDLDVVDCGCSTGKRIITVHSRFAKVRCFDVFVSAVAAARARGLDAECGDLRNLPLENKSTDLFICSETMEHLSLEDSKVAAQEIMRATRKWIVITVPEDKKICLAKTQHLQYLDRKLLEVLFQPCQVMWHGIYWKKPKRGNRVIIFQVDG